MIRARQAGAAGIVGGLVLFADLALRLLSGLGPAYFVVAALMACCLAAGPWGLLGSGALGSRSRRTAVAGSAIVTVGAALWLAAFGLLLVDPGAAFTQRLTPAGSLLMGSGWWCWAARSSTPDAWPGGGGSCRWPSGSTSRCSSSSSWRSSSTAATTSSGRTGGCWAAGGCSGRCSGSSWSGTRPALTAARR